MNINMNGNRQPFLLAENSDLTIGLEPVFDELEAYLNQPASSALLQENYLPLTNLDDAKAMTTDYLDQHQSALIEPATHPNPESLPPDPHTDHPISQKIIRRLISPPLNDMPYTNGVVRVDLSRLNRTSNLVGELFTQENGAFLQNQQMQLVVRSVTGRFSEFEQIARDVQDWMDVNQNNRANLNSNRSSNSQRSIARDQDTDSEFDSLQMDSYDRLHILTQEIIEQIAHIGESMQDLGLLANQSQQAQRQRQQTLKLIRTDLLRARMLPISNLLDRFPRMVRDLTITYKKQVQVKLIGASTLVDKVVLEKLLDPLVHLVRNAFDHGIESPELRTAQGKQTEATIEIRAYHRGNQTYIEVRDDGRGIDLKAIRRKAVSTGMVSSDQVRKLNREQLYNLLFSPGFSTAKQVTELSGRGVGLDVVQHQVKLLKGTLTLTSQLGKGTLFTLRFPLTLSLAKLLIFSIQDQIMAIPADTLHSIVMASPSSIVTVDDQSMYRSPQGEDIPVYPQSALLKSYPLMRMPRTRSQGLTLPESFMPLLLLSGEEGMMALPIDQILQEQECVIKPFGTLLKPPAYLYGCTVLGNGTLIPVIDGPALISQGIRPVEAAIVDEVTNVVEQNRDQSRDQFKSPALPNRSMMLADHVCTVLVIDDSLTARQFLAMTLEKFGYLAIQARDGREALQQLQQNPGIQAIFCDIEMPRMNGFEFLSASRQEYAEATPPTIMLTSRSSNKHRQMATKLGAVGYLTKPYLEQELLTTLQGCLATADRSR